jgi:hypothetical protein
MTEHEGPSIQNYGAPPYIADALAAYRQRAFDVDSCAEAWSAKAPRYYDGGDLGDGLVEPWAPWTYTHPGYRHQVAWLQRASWWARTAGYETACLVRASIDATYWMRLVTLRAEQHIFVGRISFIAPPGGVWLGKKKRRFVEGGQPIPGTTFATPPPSTAPASPPASSAGVSLRRASSSTNARRALLAEEAAA